MNLHAGRTKLPGTLTFMLGGYWYQHADDDDYQWIPYPQPKPQTRRIRAMWGISGRRWFIGLTRYSDPESP